MADLAHATENDTDLVGDTDARHWAERFSHYFTIVHNMGRPDVPNSVDDPEGLMLAWFAGAIESGMMAERKRRESER